MLPPSIPAGPRNVMTDMRKAMNGTWALAAAIALIDAVGLALSGMRLDPFALSKCLAIGSAPLAIAWFYTVKRPDIVIASLLESAAFLVLFTNALATASYLGTSLAWPLRDEYFDALDKAMGFDFLAHLAYVADNLGFAALLDYTYMSSMLQVVFSVLALAMTRSFERLHAYLVLFALTAGATILIATLLPTIGAYAFYNVPDALLPAFRDPRSGWDQVPHILALRNGSMREIPLADLHGLVSFPSFHTALAIITVWANLRTRYVNVAILLLNLPLIIATPTLGSHYLCDILGGSLVAFTALAFVSGFERRPARRHAFAAPTLPTRA